MFTDFAFRQLLTGGLMCTMAIAGASFTQAAAPIADTVYRGGDVVTMDDAMPQATAVAIRGDRIVAVGSDAKMAAYIGDRTEVRELRGNTLLPGFIDAHSHIGYQGLVLTQFVDLNSPPVGTIKSISQIVDRLKQRVEDTAKGDWVIGFGYDDTLVKEQRHPTREDLDKVSTQHPIWISHSSGHLGVGNSKALELAGITAATPEPEGGVIRRDPETGLPNGVFEEQSAMGPVLMLAYGSMTLEDVLAGTSAAIADYASKGITTAQEGAASPDSLGGLAMARQQGLLKIRVVAQPTVQVTLAELAGNYQIPFENDGLLKVGATKLFGDGSIQGYTGYLGHPYHVPKDPAHPEYRGYPLQSRGKLAEQVLAVHSSGRQMAIHGNGDAAIDDILWAYAQAQAKVPRKDARLVVIHSQMVREDQLDKMAELGVIPSFFNMHTYYWGDRHRDIFIGPERAARISPAQSAARRDIPFTLHADTPVVPMEPLRMLWSAVTRETADRAILGPEQRVSPERALRGLTIDAARQYFDEDDKGSITAGKLADLVVLDANPLTVPAADILGIEVLETVVGGEVVYSAE